MTGAEAKLNHSPLTIEECLFLVWVGCSTVGRLRSVSIFEIHWLRQLQSSSFYVGVELFVLP